MNKTVSEPEKNLLPIGSTPGGARRMFVAAFALVAALLVSFLVTPYSTDKAVLVIYYGQAMVCFGVVHAG